MPFTDSVKMVDVIIANKTTLNAAPGDVLVGKQFIGATQTVSVGSIPELDERSDITIAGGETYNIPFGYNPAAYNVTAKTVEEETPGTATAANILSTKTAWVNGTKLTGTMNNIGAETATLACGVTHRISEGYHDGNGVITAMDLRSQTYASIIKENILEGMTCWANGVMLTGTMPNIGTKFVTIEAGETYTVPEGYHSGSGYVKAATLESQTSATATSGNIINGYTAWVNGEKITGSIPVNAATETVLPMNGTYVIPLGYHNGLGKVTQNIPSKSGETVAPSKEEQTIEVAGYYMEGNIVVSGVDALRYQFDNAVMKDSTGTSISDYELAVTNYSSTINLYTDNWHDGSTVNNYKFKFTDLVDSTTGNTFTLSFNSDIMRGTTTVNTFGNVTVSIGFSSDNECQYVTVSGITGGKLTLTSIMCSREF